jgi:hypothetical protein
MASAVPTFSWFVSGAPACMRAGPPVARVVPTFSALVSAAPASLRAGPPMTGAVPTFSVFVSTYNVGQSIVALGWTKSESLRYISRTVMRMRPIVLAAVAAESVLTYSSINTAMRAVCRNAHKRCKCDGLSVPSAVAGVAAFTRVARVAAMTVKAWGSAM